MNCSNQPPSTPIGEGDTSLEALLHEVRLRFYASHSAAAFQRDRRGLLHALSWPAIWFERRGLFCSTARYHALVIARLDAVHAHGDPARYGAYLPTYLLKCLQDFFDHHGDALYSELKHIRNALEQLGGSLRFADDLRAQAQQIATMAAAHRLLRPHAPTLSDPRQMALF